MQSSIAVLGAGVFGSALAHTFAQSGHSVRLWARDAALCNSINSTHKNAKYCGSLPIHANVRAENSLPAALQGAQLVVYACPSSTFEALLAQCVPLMGSAPFVDTSKGLHPESLKFHHETASELLGEQASRQQFLCLSGPSFAKEILRGVPTSVALAGADANILAFAQNLLSSTNFRPYATSDVLGCELGGAVKNVIAIGVGITEGLGLGHNAQAALINRGLFELTRLGLKLGARQQTFSGLSGMGDLVLTCTSPQSRNRQLGVLIGQGLAPTAALQQAGDTVEGYGAAVAIMGLARKHGVELPICEQVHAVLHQGCSPRQACQNILARPVGLEWHA